MTVRNVVQPVRQRLWTQAHESDKSFGELKSSVTYLSLTDRLNTMPVSSTDFWGILEPVDPTEAQIAFPIGHNAYSVGSSCNQADIFLDSPDLG
jgi:hypothetical protein